MIHWEFQEQLPRNLCVIINRRYIYYIWIINIRILNLPFTCSKGTPVYVVQWKRVKNMFPSFPIECDVGTCEVKKSGSVIISKVERQTRSNPWHKLVLTRLTFLRQSVMYVPLRTIHFVSRYLHQDCIVGYTSLLYRCDAVNS